VSDAFWRFSLQGREGGVAGIGDGVLDTPEESGL